MTDEEINIAIAAHFGWRQHGHNGFQPTWIDPNGERFVQSWLPDYCNDLNAMHSAENAMILGNPDGWKFLENYPYYLGRVRKDRWDHFRATARQRAEAFLRTIGKWKEGEA